MTTLVLIYALTMFVLGVIFIYQVSAHWYRQRMAVKITDSASTHEHYQKQNLIVSSRVIPDTGMVLYSKMQVFLGRQ